MFTGIVDHCGKVLEIQPINGGRSYLISTRFRDIALGESISVDGACLTVTDAYEDGTFACDLSPETLGLTIAQRYEPGTRVNVERALLASDRLGGHFVTGHVDQVGRLVSRKQHAEFIEMTFEGVAQAHAPLLHQKGCVAVNGVSLTVNALVPGGFNVMLVPHTWERTNLGSLNEGMPVNLEFDWMAKLVVQRVDALFAAREPHGK